MSDIIEQTECCGVTKTWRGDRYEIKVCGCKSGVMVFTYHDKTEQGIWVELSRWDAVVVGLKMIAQALGLPRHD